MVIKIVKGILITVAVLLVLVGICYTLSGSMDIFPTDEQQEKAWIAGIVIIILGVLLGLIGFVLNSKER